jgi:hypothetical protein
LADHRKGKVDVSALASKPVRFHIEQSWAKLAAFHFTDG